MSGPPSRLNVIVAGSRRNCVQTLSNVHVSSQSGSRAPGLQPFSWQSMSPSPSSSTPFVQSSNVPAVTGGSHCSVPVFSPSPQTQVLKSNTHAWLLSSQLSVEQTNASWQATGVPGPHPVPTLQISSPLQN